MYWYLDSTLELLTPLAMWGTEAWGFCKKLLGNTNMPRLRTKGPWEITPCFCILITVSLPPHEVSTSWGLNPGHIYTSYLVFASHSLSFHLIPYLSFLIVISPIKFFFLLYNMVPQLHIHAYVLFSPIIILHHKWLDIVLSTFCIRKSFVRKRFFLLESLGEERCSKQGCWY